MSFALIHKRWRVEEKQSLIHIHGVPASVIYDSQNGLKLTAPASLSKLGTNQDSASGSRGGGGPTFGGARSGHGNKYWIALSLQRGGQRNASVDDKEMWN